MYRRQSTGRYDDRVEVQGQGFFVIQGPDQTAEVSITPVDLPTVLEKSNTFLKNPQTTELKIFVVAN